MGKKLSDMDEQRNKESVAAESSDKDLTVLSDKKSCSKRKTTAKWIAAATAAVLVVTGTGAYALSDLRAGNVHAAGESGTPTEEVLTSVLSQQTVSHSAEAGKEETVYVVTDASGNSNEVIVSNWLKNAEGAEELPDMTTLSDIQNVKGEETFTQGSGDHITWNTTGSDIYYQGTTDKQLPVEIRMTYFLDGTEISPEELAGKSGNVTIRFDYTNNVSENISIGGEATELYVPFAVLSGMILPLDQFTNVSVTNGKIISEGNNDIVVGLAFPGLEEDLSLSSLDTEELSDIGVSVGDIDIDIPDYIEVNADVTDFSLDMTLSMVMSDSLSTVSLTDDIDFSGVSDQLAELNGAMETLSDSSTQLVNGSTELANGADALTTGMTQLGDGAAALTTGVQAYVDGVAQLADGITSAGEGAAQVSSGAAELSTGTQALKDGAYTLASGLQSLMDGAAKVSNGVGSLAGSISDMTSQLQTAHDTYAAIQGGVGQYMGAGLSQEQALCATILGSPDAAAYAADAATLGAVQQVYGLLGQMDTMYNALNSKASDIAALAQGAGEVNHYVNQATDGAWTVYAGIDSLNTGSATLRDGAQALSDGLVQLKSGADSLTANSADLLSGVQTLSDGIKQAADGAAALQSGAHTLHDGMVQFDKEGIQVLVDKVSGIDLNHSVEFVDRLTAVLDAADDYTTFTGAPEGVDSSVKFIIRTGAVTK